LNNKILKNVNVKGREGLRLGGNLRDRLKRIQLMHETGEAHRDASGTDSKVDERKYNVVPWDIGTFNALGWVLVGHLTLRREISYGDNMVLPETMPDAVGIVMPGICAETKYEDLLFFDLETTGLSGGAGTIAFLAAFGKLVSVGNSSTYRISITQYLLLDYPGEYDFVEALLTEFKPDITVISYNGKSFDSQILKTRCLMNGITPPEYCHADLLHPSRRLWKNLLPDCSQGTIETAIFGIDRTGDTPGAMAPDIWFSFLKTGKIAPLMGICEHNLRDIGGLARIFRAMADIAANPFVAFDAIRFDMEALAIRWHNYTRRHNFFTQSFGQEQESETEQRLRETGIKLLQIAAGMECPRAEFLYALFLLRSGNYPEGRDLLLKAASNTLSTTVQAVALRTLSIDSERRLKNKAEALALAERSLELLLPDSSLRDDFNRRIRRLRGNGA
jgi:uncharacterized protein YprB with RNaseH-like and TPR domain